MRRLLVPAMVMVGILVVPALATAATPAIYHTIGGRFASAYFSSLDGCLQTDVWVSASAGTYAPQPGQHGGLNKQGLSAVEIVVYDTCQPPDGKHYPVVADWFAQTSDRLVSESRMRTARLDVVMRMTDDVSGAMRDVAVHLSWQATESAHPDTARNNHAHFPGEGVVNTHDNNYLLAAVAWGSVVLDGVNVVVEPDYGATLSEVKSSCMEIGFPHWDGETLWCFGF
jgi:hypothetical protein